MSSPEVKDAKRWTVTRKAEAVLARLKGGDVSAVRRENGISPSQVYTWRDSFSGAGQESLKSRRGRKDLREREINPR